MNKIISEASPKDDSCMKESYIYHISAALGNLRSANDCKEVARIWNSHWGPYKPGELHVVRGYKFCLGKNMERHEKGIFIATCLVFLFFVGRNLQDLSFFLFGVDGKQ